jgi:hypothetical protein
MLTAEQMKPKWMHVNGPLTVRCFSLVAEREPWILKLKLRGPRGNQIKLR